MTHHHSTLRTPMWQDKRFLLTVYAVTLVVALCALGKAAAEVAVGAITTLVLAFVAQSQLGQTKRTTELLKAAADAPPEQR